MATAGRIAYNVVFNAIAKVISTALALVAIGFVTRYLGKEGFGNYATMLAFFAFFNAIGDLGLQSVAAREISRENSDEKTIMSNVLSLRMIISFIIFLFTPLLAFILPYSPELKIGIVIAGAAFFFSSISMILNGVFQKYLVMDRVATTELGGKLIQLSIIIAAVHYDFGFIAIALALLAYMAFNALVILFISHRYIPFTLHINKAYWIEFLKSSLPLGVASIVTFAYFKMDTILLSFMRTSAEVGIYNVAYKVIENLIFFPAMITGLVLPLLSRFAFTDQEKFNLTANKTFKVFLVLVVPLVTGAFFLAPQIVSIIGGAGFPESVLVLKILVFALAFVFFGQFFNTILIVNNLQQKLMKALVGAAVINIILNAIFIQKYSYIGAAASSVATELCVVLFSSYLVFKHTKYRPGIPHLPSILFSGLIMGLFLAFFPALPLAILILGSIFIYLSCLWMTNAIEKEEILSVISGSRFSRRKNSVAE